MREDSCQSLRGGGGGLGGEKVSILCEDGSLMGSGRDMNRCKLIITCGSEVLCALDLGWHFTPQAPLVVGERALGDPFE